MFKYYDETSDTDDGNGKSDKASSRKREINASYTQQIYI